MPHAFVLCDTVYDERVESVRAAAMGCDGVRPDTPRFRRGNMRSIIEEMRWEPDARGHSDVKILLSGGVTREDVLACRDVADAFGAGGAIANAPPLPAPRACRMRARRSVGNNHFI